MQICHFFAARALVLRAGFFKLFVLFVFLGLMVSACAGNKRAAYESVFHERNTLQDAVRGEGETNPQSGKEKNAKQNSDNESDQKNGARIPSELNRFQISTINPLERPSDPSSLEAGLWYQADNFERDLQTQGDIIIDPALQAYLQTIMCKIAGAYCHDFRLYIVRVPTFNATMMANGTMQIYSGLLSRAKNEAEIAAIIGHEMGHYLRRHTLAGLKNKHYQATIRLISSMLALASGNHFAHDMVSQISILSEFSYSRDNERESDGYGAVLMADAGYNPDAAFHIWQTVQKEGKAQGRTSGSLALSTHPPSKERDQVLQKMAARLKSETTQTLGLFANRYESNIWRHRRSWIMDEIKMGKNISSHFIIDQLLENNRDLAGAYFLRGEAYRQMGLRVPSPGDEEAVEKWEALEEEERTSMALQKALDAYEQSLAQTDYPHPRDLHKSRGLIFNKLGRKQEAKAAFQQYLEDNPNASDRLLINMMLSETTS